jgi:predicted nucleic acid-binding protein
MRLVVLDTNVIVSARVSPRSTPAKLLVDWILAGEVQTVTSPAIILEYREGTCDLSRGCPFDLNRRSCL